jgi:hypothetical protein
MSLIIALKLTIYLKKAYFININIYIIIFNLLDDIKAFINNL